MADRIQSPVVLKERASQLLRCKVKLVNELDKDDLALIDRAGTLEHCIRSQYFLDHIANNKLIPHKRGCLLIHIAHPPAPSSFLTSTLTGIKQFGTGVVFDEEV